MEFESLRAIWSTQTQRPVYRLNDSRLAVVLYRQREESRGRLFRQQFGRIFLALFFAAGNALVFYGFFTKTLRKVTFSGTDPRMSVWDGVALAGAVIAAMAVAVSRYTQHRKRERTLNVFPPSLREELEQGIAQLDFESSLYSTAPVARRVAALLFGATVMFWEFGRLIGEPVPWVMLPAIMSVYLTFGVEFTVGKKIMRRVTERRCALDSMLAQLKKEDVEPRR